MMNPNNIQKVEIDQENKKMYIYYMQDNSHLMSNPPPPPSYYREIYSFDKLYFIEKEYAKVERSFEKITYKKDEQLKFVPYHTICTTCKNGGVCGCTLAHTLVTNYK